MIIYISFWIVCSIVCFLISFNYCQKKYPIMAYEDYYENTLFCFIMSVFGPFSLVSFIMFWLMNR